MRDGVLDAVRGAFKLGEFDATAALSCAMSPAAIDRRLAAGRAQLQVKGTALTKPGPMLNSKIPMKTWAEWDDATPGFLVTPSARAYGAEG